MQLKATLRQLAGWGAVLGALAIAALPGCGGGGSAVADAPQPQPPQPMVTMVAYVTNGGVGGSNDVSGYAIDTATGALTSVGPAVPAGTNPVAIKAEPSGRFAYVANADSNNISAYAINPATGALTLVGTVASGTHTESISVPATGNFVFVTSIFGRNTGVYSINATTGVLTSIATDVVAGRFVTLDPLGRFIFVVNDNDTITTYALDGATGSLRPLATTSTASHSRALGVDPTGKFAYLGNPDSNELAAYAINPVTGVLSQVGAPVSGGLYGPDFEPKGRFLYAGSSHPTRLIYAINAGTGELTATGPTIDVYPLSNTHWSFEPTAKFLFESTYYTTHGFTYSYLDTKAIDPATGALSVVSNVTGYPEYWAKPAVDPQGKFAYVAVSGHGTGVFVRTYAIGASTGALTEVGRVPGTGQRPTDITLVKLR